MNTAKKIYLSHIGGLRGIAILMVILFHLLPSNFSQGFLGVDIFLVISGFLLFRGFKPEKEFLFNEFVQKKILRIMPPFACALLITGICTIPVLFSESDITILGSSIAYSIFGLSNRYYQNLYADYFSAGANMNPLLHTWYLAVILQIYLLWAIGCRTAPLFTPPCYRNYKYTKYLICCILIISLASLIYSHSYQIQGFISQIDIPTWGQTKEVSYYSTFGRLWQVAAGGLVFLLPLHHNKCVNTSLSLMGLVLIILTGCCNLSFAPFGAIITVISTILLIKYTPDTPLERFLNNKILQWFGKISFSLYLVHFPIIVIYKRWWKLQPDFYSGSILLLVITLITWLMYHCVENRKWNLVATFIIVVFTGVFALGLRYEHKLGNPISKMFEGAYPSYATPSNTPPNNILNNFDIGNLKGNAGTFSLMDNGSNESPSAIMPLGKCTSPEFVLIGDSNAQHLYSGMHELCISKAIHGIHLTTTVIPLEDYYYKLENYDGYEWTREKAESLYAWLDKHPEIHTVIISQLWERFFPNIAQNWNQESIETSFNDNAKRLMDFSSKLRQLNKHVILVMPSPIFLNFDKDLHGNGLEYSRWLARRHGYYFDTNNPNDPFVLTEHKYKEHYRQFLDLFDKWEKEGFCSVLHIERSMFKNGNYLGFKNGTLYCKDATHITPPASIELMEGVADEFEQLIIKGRKMSTQTN